jgi:ribokinase
MRRGEIVVVGGINSDYLVRGARLPAPGETVQGDAFREGPGGKGANQAVGIARLGVRVALLARVGADARGEVVCAALLREGLDLSLVSRDSEQPTGAALIAVDQAGEKQIVTAPGANLALSESDIEAARARIALSELVLVGLEVPLAAVSAALRLGKAAGVKTLLDPAPALPLSEELLRLVDVISPNDSEAEVLTNVKVSDARSAAQCARVLLARGASAAIVRGGADGTLVATSTEQHVIPRHSVSSVDATGAGDAFMAALAVALGEGRSLVDAAVFANAAGAFSTTRVGAQAGLPRRNELAPLLAEHRVLVSRGGP